MLDEFYLFDLGIGIGKKFGMTDERVGLVWMMSSMGEEGWLAGKMPALRAGDVHWREE